MGTKRVAAIAACVGAGVLAASGASAIAGINPDLQPMLGTTTLDERIVPVDGAAYARLTRGPGESRVVREEGIGTAKPGREGTRKSIAYFGQLSDFQLADEESPARVEFLDPQGGEFTSSWRPGEALNPHIDDSMVQQLNAFSGASPVAGGDGSRRAMDFTIDTGDSADNQQLNETVWVRTLLEGGPLDPGSGVSPAGYDHPYCPGAPGYPAGPAYEIDEPDPEDYTGVQDRSDFSTGDNHYFYDPDDPDLHGDSPFVDFPEHPGLMDAAQEPFEATGLSVPSYVTFGNHDALLQGNLAAKSAFEKITTGCLKPVADQGADVSDLLGIVLSGDLTEEQYLDVMEEHPDQAMAVPPDPMRRLVSKRDYKNVFRAGTQADGHGFGLIDPAVESASNGAAGYYSFTPVPGLRMISMDSVSEGGVVLVSDKGNIDDPQFQWLKGQLEQAKANDELVVAFSHHGSGSMTADVPDEAAPTCGTLDEEGNEANPGCDLDPRPSTPIHLGNDVIGLFHQYPNVIAWIAGHSHVNDIDPRPNPAGGGFWEIKVAAEADWPQQGRLLELFDNGDGTLSIFGTIVDHAAAPGGPSSGEAGDSMDVLDMASLGRTIAHNDNQTGGRSCGGGPCGEGGPADRNVELLITDPRRGPQQPGPGPEPQPGAKRGKVKKGKAVLFEGRLYVRVSCARKPAGACKVRTVAVTKRKRGKALTKPASTRVRKGRSKVVAMKVRPKMVKRLQARKRVLVRTTTRKGKRPAKTRFQNLKLIVR